MFPRIYPTPTCFLSNFEERAWEKNVSLSLSMSLLFTPMSQKALQCNVRATRRTPRHSKAVRAFHKTDHDAPEWGECLKCSTFRWSGHYYRQVGGLAMGQRLAPTLVIAFMSKIEQSVLERKLYCTVVTLMTAALHVPLKMRWTLVSSSLREKPKENWLPFLNVGIQWSNGSDEGDDAETSAAIKFVNNLSCCLNWTIDKLQGANNQSPQTGSARTATDQSSDETVSPDDAVWLSEDHSDTSRETIEEEFICRTLKPSQMKLPRFWGDEEEFPEFWAVYETLVHQNKVLSTVEKMLLLKESLRGKAEMTIKGIQLIPQNYKWMVGTIKKKYGNKPINRAKIVQKLIDLPCARNNAENCTYIFDKIRMLINQMVLAGQDIPNTQDVMWKERILEKFPYNIVKNVLISIQEMEDVKVENVMEQLEKEINAKKIR
ncbi:hypothetical protein RB195_018156 [Necator americanus]|uniref:Uncharacterized protein n=1 Tax=Necator americanus TaxID=51031 RepID=A0ABR1C9I7_NECAM